MLTKTKTYDYIKQTNSIYNSLLNAHQGPLGTKNVHTKQDLIQIIKLDLDKITHALLEVKNNFATQVIHDFFRKDPSIVPTIEAKLKSERIDHLGFEIHEPLDLVIYGINHWMEQSIQSLDVHIKIRDYLRFPASQALQSRVGAYTEIMRIWIEVGDQDLMLELFDMYRPVDTFLSNGSAKTTHRNFDGLFTIGEPVPHHHHVLPTLFRNDEIWHYAVSINSPALVRQLHRDFQSLVNTTHHYHLPYESVVINQHDRSIHTKIVNPTRGLEIEFVSQLD